MTVGTDLGIVQWLRTDPHTFHNVGLLLIWFDSDSRCDARACSTFYAWGWSDVHSSAIQHVMKLHIAEL